VLCCVVRVAVLFSTRSPPHAVLLATALSLSVVVRVLRGGARVTWVCWCWLLCCRGALVLSPSWCPPGSWPQRGRPRRISSSCWGIGSCALLFMPRENGPGAQMRWVFFKAKQIAAPTGLRRRLRPRAAGGGEQLAERISWRRGKQACRLAPA
jgi:hypothetical protein